LFDWIQFQFNLDFSLKYYDVSGVRDKGCLR
jgi:hypothetical protein